MDRILNRAFSKVHGDVTKVQADVVQPGDEDGQEKKAEQAPPSTISAILQFWKDKEYFKLLQLPNPAADELGRPSWPCTSLDVSRAYRKLSVEVHPDKNPGPEARAAFEALNECHRMLKDPGKLEEVLKEVAGRVRLEREREESRVADSEGRAALLANKNAQAKKLRKEEGAAFEDTIRQQMKRRQEEAARKVALKSASRGSGLRDASGPSGEVLVAAGSSDDDEGRVKGKQQSKVSGSGSDEEDAKARQAARQAAAARKRKRPTNF